MKRIRTITWLSRVGLRTVLFLFAPVGAVLIHSCSTDEPYGTEKGLIAVEFTTSINDGAYIGRSPLNDMQIYTGVNEAGVPYRDFTDEKGFRARAFCPGTSPSDNNVIGTRTANGGDAWANGDKVGIFMVSTGGSLRDGIVAAGGWSADNREYNVNASTGELSPQDAGPLYYPQSGAVDFVAYHPHSGLTGSEPGRIDNYVYYMTVEGQTSDDALSKLDVLYARASAVAASENAVNLTFDHVLSKVTFNVVAGNAIEREEIQNMPASAVTFKGMPLNASLALQDGLLTAGAKADFNPLKGTAGAADAVFTALIVPQPQDSGATSGGLPNLSGRMVIFTVDGVDYTWRIPDSEVFEAGQHYTYPVTVQKNEVVIGERQITTWTPSANPQGSGDAELIAMHIPAGKFLMGCAPDEPDSHDYREVRHEVTLTRDFYMAKYPVTSSQYAAFLNATGVGKDCEGTVEYLDNGYMTSYTGRFLFYHPQHFPWGVYWDDDENMWLPYEGYDDHPVILVTWYGAKAYADWVGGALPTEAQWEYACRGGQQESLPFGIGDGTKLVGGMANFFIRGSYELPGGWYDADDETVALYQIESTTPVGYYPYPNGYGLYDMHGNVEEWCYDWWDQHYGSVSPGDPATNPTGAATGYDRVIRGGSWWDYAMNCRSAWRPGFTPGSYSEKVGLRVVFTI